MLKFFEINSIRYRMLSGFLFLSLVIVIMAAVSLYMVERNRQVLQIHAAISELQVSNLNLIKLQNEFFSSETINEEYFQTKQSSILFKRDSILEALRTELQKLLRKSKQYGYPIEKNIFVIDSLTVLSNTKFDELVDFSVKRGFRDFGIEGQMREHAHLLENPEMKMNLADVLSLRRREKDFLLREDTLYVNYFNSEWFKLNEALSRDSLKYATSLFHLNQYHSLFNELVEIKKIIGLKGGTGLSKELGSLTSILNERYYELSDYSRRLSYSFQQTARVFYIITISGVLIFSIISAFWISKRLSAPIAALSRWMNHESAKKKSSRQMIKLDKAAAEIKVLTHTFATLIKQRDDQVDEIRKKSKLLKKRNSELKKTNSELDSFLYSTAHDLRSPLSSLLGLLRLMELENKQPDLTKYFNLMQESIHRLEDFLQQIVDYSKNKKIELNSEKIELHKVISETFNNHLFLEGAERIEKIIEIREDSPLFSDKSRIQIIFNNLISNAIRYADPAKPKPTIRISAHITERELTLDFADNGLGIEKEYLHRIFEMFYRANTKSKGSGLGLFIFRETIHKMGGYASVESEVGVGTKFFVRIPNLLTKIQQQNTGLLIHN